MKTHLKKLLQVAASGAGLAIAALLGGSVQTSAAATADPSAGSSFTWDLLSDGSGQKGIAFITFSNDLTFSGYEMWGSAAPNTNTPPDGRGGSESRGSGLSSSSSVSNLFVFGFSRISGLWNINAKKQIVGFFAVILNATSEGTNYNPGVVLETITNPETLETTNLLITFAAGQSEVITNFAWANPPPGSPPITRCSTRMLPSASAPVQPPMPSASLALPPQASA